MKIENIESPFLLKLVREASKGSSTISADVQDAVEDACDDGDLISNWQSKLEDLKYGIEYYWWELEKYKMGGDSE